MMESGRVIKSTGSWYQVETASGETIACRLPGRFRLEGSEDTNPVAVGDRVRVERMDDGAGQIRDIEERTNTMIRQATHGRRGNQVMAANIDLGICVQAVKRPEFKTGFIDRFLVTCDANQIHGLVFINKMDLATDRDRAELADLEALYTSLGYEWMTGSVTDPASIQALKTRIADETVMFMGPSGTGKSSLLNALAPGLRRDTKAVSDFSNKGKHTTTFAEMLALPDSGYVIDTPGVREFGIVDVDKPGLSNFFPEMKTRRESCKYYNCTHVHEPGCAVMAAYEEGTITATRYNSYLNILDSLPD
jgi:ribosome biogenesis GTPase